jgi:hypothetical protein
MTKDMEDLISRLGREERYYRERAPSMPAEDAEQDEGSAELLAEAASALSSLSLRVEELEGDLARANELLTAAVDDYNRASAELTRLRTTAVDNDSVRGREGE